MSSREELESALADAEMVLVTIVMHSDATGPHRDDMEAKIEKSRADCRKARNALLNFDRSETAKMSDRSLNILITDLHAIGKHVTSSSGNFARQSGRIGVAEKIAITQDEPRQERPPVQLEFDPTETEAGKNRPNQRSQIIRQSIGLFALSLAYLQYYFLNIYVQIAVMPVAYSYLVR